MLTFCLYSYKLHGQRGEEYIVLTRQLVCAAQLVPHLLKKCLVAVEVAIPYRRPFLDVVYELLHI